MSNAEVCPLLLIAPNVAPNVLRRTNDVSRAKNTWSVCLRNARSLGSHPAVRRLRRGHHSEGEAGRDGEAVRLRRALER